MVTVYFYYMSVKHPEQPVKFTTFKFLFLHHGV